MASQRPPKSPTMPPPKPHSRNEEDPADILTPKQLLQFIAVGTGENFDRTELKAFLKSAPNAIEVARQSRELIEILTSLTIPELHKVAQETAFKKTKKAQTTRRKIRTAMTDNLSFLREFKKSNRIKNLNRLCKEAEQYLNHVRAEYFANDGESLPNNEVMVCNDPAELMLMAFSEEALEKIKLEASVKLAIAYILGLRESQTEDQEEHERALNFLLDILNNRVHKVSEGAKIGQVFRRYMVSKHDPLTFRTSEAGIVEEKILAADPTIRVTPLISRRTIVADGEGREREIYFYEVPRQKTDFSALTKDIRYNELGRSDRDKNGFRFVFNSKADFEDFMKMFMEEVRSEIKEGLMERIVEEEDRTQISVIKSRLRNLDSSIVISNKKGDLEKGAFDATSKSGSRELQVHKFRVTITTADGRIYTYEFQVFIPIGFADYLYRQGMSWEEFMQKRFWDSGVDQVLLPKKANPGLDSERIQKRMIKMAHQKAWNSNGEMTKSTALRTGTITPTEESQATPKSYLQSCYQPSVHYCEKVE